MSLKVLLILDGWGIAPKNRGNAIELARKPNFDKFWDRYPHTELKAHGEFVGLFKDEVGNSEAGHMSIGAGRLIKDDAVTISEDIASGKLFKNTALLQAIETVKKNKSRLHLMGLISDGSSPHAYLDHLYALVDFAYQNNIEKVYLHLFTDGRDAQQFTALRICDQIAERIANKATIASLIGRFYAMDRGKNWLRTKKAYDLLTAGEGKLFPNYNDAILSAYNQSISDEFIEPSIIAEDEKESRESRLQSKDVLIFFNTRSDRARQIAKCFVQKNFNEMNKEAFRRRIVAKNFLFCALTDFGPDLDHILTAYPAGQLDYTLPGVLQEKKQLYIAETEKYAHVTYFINGGSADPVNGEERVRIPSLRIKSYSEKPEMSVYKITKYVELAMKKNYEFITINFANPDMVGHTGDLAATIKAIEHVDICLGSLVNLVLKKKGDIILTADHGNAEKMIDLDTNEIWTGHTANPVPFLLVSDGYKGAKLKKGTVCNVAPTIYDLFGIKHLPKLLYKSIIK